MIIVPENRGNQSPALKYPKPPYWLALFQFIAY
jgi:hypothetical protein